MLDLVIVVSYFVLIFVIAISGKSGRDMTSEEYFLSSRKLKWHSIAISSIATNINGYQFLGMMGSAYLYGLAQANLEINAVQGILLAAFVFVPMYLRDGVITITQFIKKRLGNTVGLFYSLANLALFSTVTLGAALFWGAYAADLIFAEYLYLIHPDRIMRIAILILGLGVFSAIYTYFGGLSAVVRTDIIQFAILMAGGIVILFTSIHHLGGWQELYIKTPDKMHLHLPANHDKLPWTHLFGLFLLNINYWCANQTIVQRSLAAKNLRHAQIGLMVGGLTKYVMAAVIIIPGIALYGILGDDGLGDPDMAFPHLVDTYLPTGVKGLILCALFASLMSTVDSTFNSLATLWSVDIYKEYINKGATDKQLVATGRRTILVCLFTALVMGLLLLYIKFDNPETAFTHTLNELRYYINCGIVVLICTAVILTKPKNSAALLAFLLTIPLNFFIQHAFPEVNYFVRAFWVISTGILLVTLASGFRFQNLKSLWEADSKTVRNMGLMLALSLVALHVAFH